jgi:putative oxidoreductase
VSALKSVLAGLLGAALVFQIWYEAHVFGREPLTFLYVYRIVLIAGFALLLLSRGRFRSVNAAVRLWIAVDFAYSIADRFGFVGHYGSPGVSWGNWKNFVAYTHVLTGVLPLALVPLLAVAATLYEAVLAVTLAVGICSRVFCLAAALLTGIYVVTMSLTGGFMSQFDYAVLLLCLGSLFLAVVS